MYAGQDGHQGEPMRRPRQLCFIGDSITHAHRRPEEIHDVYYLGHGYVSRLAGVLGCRHPEADLQITNQGVCGDDVHRLWARWETDCLNLKPDLLSVLIGVNDCVINHIANPDESANEFERLYLRLLRTVRMAQPDVVLVVMEPFALRVEPQGHPHPSMICDRSKAVLPYASATRRIANAIGARFIPLQERFDIACRRVPARHWTMDGVHPSAAGHELITQAWMEDAEELLQLGTAR